jgi:zinc transport system permease protein
VVLAGAAGALNVNLFSYLFGSILTVDRAELLVVAVIGSIVVGVTLALRRALFALAVDEEWATVAGLPSKALGSLVAALTAVTIVASMRIVGLLLVAAFLALPVAAAQLLSRSFRGTLAWSVVIGCFSVVVGLTLARLWALAPGGTIVLVCAALFAGLAVTGRRRGEHVLLRLLQADRVPREP